MDVPAAKMSSLWWVPLCKPRDLLHVWWHATLKWVIDRPPNLTDTIRSDLRLSKASLHHLVVSGLPDSASSRALGSSQVVTLDIASRGIGTAGLCGYRSICGMNGEILYFSKPVILRLHSLIHSVVRHVLC